jgi:hypothetical protein
VFWGVRVLQQPDRVKSYLGTVRRQIRWKRAHPFVLEEIKNHIIDQRDAFLREGLDEETAVTIYTIIPITITHITPPGQ